MAQTKRSASGRKSVIALISGIREKAGLSQSQFANLLGVSVRTLQDWEQGRRAPSGAARMLLLVAAKRPKTLLEVARWALLAAAVVVTIGVLFRVAPDREPPPKLITRGVLTASLLWIVASVGFSLYVDNFGSYGKTCGALAGVVVLLLWIWIGVYALLLGATVEALGEDHQAEPRHVSPED